MVWEAVDIRGIDVAAQDTPDLTDETVGAIRALFDNFPTKRAALIPALHLAQNQVGYLPPKTISQVAELIELAPAEVLDVVSFYEMFHTQPVGKKLVQVCQSMSCELCGELSLLEKIKTKLGIDVGETTEDGQFTLHTVECLAACDKGPVVLVNDHLYEKVTDAELDEILQPPAAAEQSGDSSQESVENDPEPDTDEEKQESRQDEEPAENADAES